jgi:hypothetical protein
MRSLTRVSVLMGPPGLDGHSGCYRHLTHSEIQQWKHHAISKKALRKQGPVPIGHG